MSEYLRRRAEGKPPSGCSAEKEELSKLLSRWDFYNEVRNRMIKVKDEFILEHNALLDKYDARDYT